SGLDGVISFAGYKNHAEALQYLVDSDAALIFVRQGDITSATGKVFEYIAAGRPIIGSLEPEGACGQILSTAGFGQWLVRPGDAQGLVKAIHELDRIGWSAPRSERTEIYNRRHAAATFANLLDSVAAGETTNRI